ncbi:cell wall-binding repeat-containing protein [Clostridium sp. DJ247]|uniref:cell wall-binding repeat-containing protein n=1 Tax=Clostridium sp. DJ247 TaxID=2726188 RepID=UPI001628EB71|nr:cell wall-binding repeat-containing protein [Clostridium sp. DJ247]MBC2582441.1 cell wall-binding repeat-containing protein [Clostridium sp. DJ247]
MYKNTLGYTFALIVGFILFFTSSINAASVETKRLSGKDRYQTCSEIVNEGWKSSDYAILVNGENFPDALSASVLAKKYNAPILLTQKGSLDLNAENQLKRLNVKKVFIIGGPGVVSPLVEDKLHNISINVERFYGADRNETSIAVAKQIGTDNGIILTTDSDFTDALSVAPVAARLQMPIILMPKDSVPVSVSSFIVGKNIPKTYVLGGNDLISDSVAFSFPNLYIIPGADKYVRNTNIMDAFADNFNFDNAYIAYSEKFADALSGSALAALNGNPIILVGDKPSSVTKNFVLAKKLTKLNVLGGTAGITQSTLDNLLDTTTPTSSEPSTLSPNTSSGHGLIKGNINSKGEKIYHVPGGQFYENTVPEAWFNTEEEAQATGYRRSKK